MRHYAIDASAKSGGVYAAPCYDARCLKMPLITPPLMLIFAIFAGAPLCLRLRHVAGAQRAKKSSGALIQRVRDDAMLAMRATLLLRYYMPPVATRRWRQLMLRVYATATIRARYARCAPLRAILRLKDGQRYERAPLRATREIHVAVRLLDYAATIDTMATRLAMIAAASDTACRAMICRARCAALRTRRR